MTKQKAIKQAWGDFYELYKNDLTSDGRLYRTDFMHEHRNGFLIEALNLKNINGYYWPDPITNIKTNNGWIKIESKEDLPENGVMYKVIHDNGKTGFSKDTSGWILNDREGFYAFITHYKIYIEDLLPIY